jgi:hypothetical protein
MEMVRFLAFNATPAVMRICSFGADKLEGFPQAVRSLPWARIRSQTYI